MLPIFLGQMSRAIASKIICLGLIVFSTYMVYSQSGTSSVSGTISDAQGNSVAGATVTLISQQNSRRTALTNDTGVYFFASVQPGTYTIETEAKGFKKANLSAFQALVDKTTTIDIALEVGQVTEVVNVDSTGVDSIINTQDAKLGANFVAQQIINLPLNARNVSNLLSLQANVTPDGSVAGGRADQANITLDGIDVNNQQDASAFAPVLRVNPDTVDEFRVTTSNPDATQGRSSGAQISLITKAGSNTFHGALYEYHRNTVTTANTFFNNKAGIPRPQLLRNLFGGSLGGPIVKNRLFFFYNYEGMREAKGSSVVRTVPLPSLGQGIVKFRDSTPGGGNLITLTAAQINSLTSGGQAVVDVNPVALSALSAAAAKYPANDFSTGDGLNTAGYRFNAPAPVKQNGHTARFDWQVTGDGKHLISFRGNYQQDVSGGVPAFLDTPPTNTWSHPLGVAASYTWLISNSMTNRFSAGLTRVAFSNQGDSDLNAITFRSVLSPALFNRTANRVNPTQNYTDDFTWVKGNHTLQFGTNIRLIRNKRSNFGAAYDSGITNFSYYEGAGNSALVPVNDYLRALYNCPPAPPFPPGCPVTISSAWTTSLGHAITAVWGRLSEYHARFNFGLDGKPIGVGKPATREWATEEYDWYGQDSWKLRPNLTITAGLRYGLSRPVYETQGFQVAPNIPLQEYLQRRIEASANGINYDVPLIMELAGPKNNAKDFYKLDTNNFQPSISVAWSPRFKSGFLAKVFGREGESTLRGGYRIINDYFGQQLAVTFDSVNTLGYSTTRDISANAYNVFDCPVPTATCRPAPLYTGPTMSINTLPGIIAPATLAFPQQQPQDFQRRIETSLDTNLQSPVNYSWNISYTRTIPGGLVVDVSYVGRLARHLLATRDVMTPNNITDPKSGMTWYQAATILEVQRQAGVPLANIQSIPFFDNLWTPGSLSNGPNPSRPFTTAAGLTNTQAIYQRVPLSGDWTEIQNRLDDRSGKRYFYQSQYGALSSFGTIGSSDYHGGSLSIRQRLKGLTWDLNYTFSKSMDDASGLQTGGTFGSAFILNALRQEDARSVSDFDLTHVVNFNSVWEIPIGKGQKLFSGMNKVADAILGGWQLSTIFRYNTGYPIYGFFDNSGWQTNWNVRSNGTRLYQVNTHPSATSGTGGVPNLFGNVLQAYQSYRTPYPGESGDRNQLRYPSYFTLDAGLSKSFTMPWKETHKVQIRWEVFNVTNSARFTGLANTALGYNPSKGLPASTFANFTGTQGSPRVMQFAFRYDF